MGDTWHGVLGVLCHVSKSWAQGQPPIPPPTILTLATNLHHLGEPHQAIQAHTNHISWVMGVC